MPKILTVLYYYWRDKKDNIYYSKNLPTVDDLNSPLDNYKINPDTNLYRTLVKQLKPPVIGTHGVPLFSVLQFRTVTADDTTNGKPTDIIISSNHTPTEIPVVAGNSNDNGLATTTGTTQNALTNAAASNSLSKTNNNGTTKNALTNAATTNGFFSFNNAYKPLFGLTPDTQRVVLPGTLLPSPVWAPADTIYQVSPLDSSLYNKLNNLKNNISTASTSADVADNLYGWGKWLAGDPEAGELTTVGKVLSNTSKGLGVLDDVYATLAEWLGDSVIGDAFAPEFAVPLQLLLGTAMLFISLSKAKSSYFPQSSPDPIDAIPPITNHLNQEKNLNDQLKEQEQFKEQLNFPKFINPNNRYPPSYQNPSQAFIGPTSLNTTPPNADNTKNVTLTVNMQNPKKEPAINTTSTNYTVTNINQMVAQALTDAVKDFTVGSGAAV